MMNLPEYELVEIDMQDGQMCFMEVDTMMEIAPGSKPDVSNQPGGYSIEQDACLQSTEVLVSPTVDGSLQGSCSDWGDKEMSDDEYAFFQDLLSQPVPVQNVFCSSGSSADSLTELQLTEDSDREAMELIGELFQGDDILNQESAVGATTSAPKLPMIEPQQHQYQDQRQEQQQYQHLYNHQDQSQEQQQYQHQPQTLEQPLSPAASNDEGFGSFEALSCDREAEIDEMVAYIKEVIEKSSSTKPDDMSSKLKVHEVILVILLNGTHGNKSRDLRRILAFCDENGRESSTECRHFKTLDTETMGLLWKKIKGNRKASYDTFARAMRVRREKSMGYFDYLDSGKRSKKRIYRFGEKTMAEMARLKRALRQFSEPQACGY